MAYVQQEKSTSRGITLADRVRELEDSKRLKERDLETKSKVKKFKWPFRWRRKYGQSTKARFNDMMLVIFLNKKGQVEPPKFMPIYDGNMIVWKNKPYEFDPRAVWTIQGMRKNPQAYIIKEIDRRPVKNKYGQVVYRDSAISNLDIDDIRERGDSTESDEFLIKAALKAQTTNMKGKMNVALFVIIAIVVVGGIIWFLNSGA